MNFNHYISVLWAAILLMAASVTSCQDHGIYDGGNGDVTTKEIAISVVLPHMGGSRATYEIGDAYENTVNLADNDFRLLLFDFDNNTLLCSFDPAQVTYEITNSAAYSVCTMRAEVDEAIASYNDMRLVMLANWGDYPVLTVGSTTIDDLAGYVASTGDVLTDNATTFDASGQLVASDSRFIPLFGVTECRNIGWNIPGEYVPMGYLWLLRSVAKIEVRSADRLPPIESVELTRYNAKGTCAPRGIYSGDGYLAGPTQYKPSNYVTLPGGKNDAGTKNYKLACSPEDGETFVVYVPEYQILSDYSKPKEPNADRPVLNVRFKGVDQTYQVDFKYYTDEAASDGGEQGDYFDIRRNYIYRYDLRLEGNGLTWHVDVLPYTSVELNPNFGLLLENITLDKYVVRLYTDPNVVTESQEVVTAYDENNKQLTSREVDWRYSESISNHVCKVVKNSDGTFTIRPNDHTTGRDIVEIVTIDKNGFEVTAECIVEVTESHLGLEKTFLGLIPKNILENYSHGSFRVNIVAKRDEQSTLTWELVDAYDQSVANDMQDLVTITAEGDGGTLSNGDNVNEKNITIHVQANDQSKFGEVRLKLTCDGPDPSGTGNRRYYNTYCDITVSDVSMTVYPSVLNLTVGQQSSVTARTAPVFSDYIPVLSFESEDPNVATVDENGLVIAVGQGTTQIKVSSPDELLSGIEPRYVQVNILPDDLILLRADGTTADHVELMSGEVIQLKAFSHGDDVSANENVTWEFESPFIRSISNGVLTAGSAGTSTVKATYRVGDVTYSETCIVVVAATRKLVISEFPNAVTSNASVPMKAYVFPDSIPYDRRTYDIAWTSNNAQVVAFDDPDDKSLAVAKNPGTANLTATTVYNGVSLQATAQITVLGGLAPDPDPNPEPEFHLYIYNANGERIKEITTKDGNYQTVEDIPVGMDNFEIPGGETWRAEVVFKDGSQTPNISCTWARFVRLSYHKPRIEIRPNGKSCELIASSEKVGRWYYNEVIVNFEYNGVNYSRRFYVRVSY